MTDLALAGKCGGLAASGLTNWACSAGQQIGAAVALEQIQQRPSADAAAQMSEQIASRKTFATTLAAHHGWNNRDSIETVDFKC